MIKQKESLVTVIGRLHQTLIVNNEMEDNREKGIIAFSLLFSVMRFLIFPLYIIKNRNI